MQKVSENVATVYFYFKFDPPKKTLPRWYGSVRKVFGKYPPLPRLNKHAWVGMQTFSAHPFAGQTEETLQPAEKGSRFPSLCLKFSSPYTFPPVQCTLYITSTRYFLRESSFGTSHNQCCHVVFIKPCPPCYRADERREGPDTRLNTNICTSWVQICFFFAVHQHNAEGKMQ